MTEASIIDCCIIVAMGFDGHQGVHIPHCDCGVMAARQEIPATPMHAEELKMVGCITDVLQEVLCLA